MTEHPSWATTGYDELENDPELRLSDARIRGHQVFDVLWSWAQPHRSRNFVRAYCYEWLASKLGIPVDGCHFKLFDVEMCEKAIEFCVNTNRFKVTAWARNLRREARGSPHPHKKERKT